MTKPQGGEGTVTPSSRAMMKTSACRRRFNCIDFGLQSQCNWHANSLILAPNLNEFVFASIILCFSMSCHIVFKHIEQTLTTMRVRCPRLPLDRTYLPRYHRTPHVEAKSVQLVKRALSYLPRPTDHWSPCVFRPKNPHR